MISAGRHKARAIEGALGFAGNGSEQVAVLFEVTEGDDAGQQITWYGFFTEKTEQRTLESLQHCGWTGNDISDLDGITANEVQLVVELEKSDQDGKDYPKVRWVNKASAGLALKSRMDDVQKRQFAERMKGKVLAMRAAQPPTKPSANGSTHGSARTPSKGERYAAPAGASDDDIPF